MAKRRRGWVIAVIVLSLLVLIIVIAASVADEPLRRYVEDKANSVFPGFHVTIGALDLHPLTLSADLRDVVVRQDTHPDPPVLSIPHLTADALLVPLFSGQVGAGGRFDGYTGEICSAGPGSGQWRMPVLHRGIHKNGAAVLQKTNLLR